MVARRRPARKLAIIVTGQPGRLAEDHRILLERIERPSDGPSQQGGMDEITIQSFFLLAALNFCDARGRSISSYRCADDQLISPLRHKDYFFVVLEPFRFPVNAYYGTKSVVAPQFRMKKVAVRPSGEGASVTISSEHGLHAAS